MNILIFNWRDIKNPKSGGSEIYFHELAKRWIKKGNSVEMIVGGWKGCKKEENIDGVSVIRVGTALTLYALAPFAYKKLRQKPDVIIDVENGIPFFTPLFAKEKKVLHIHHVHKDVWFKELNPVFASVGYFIETKIMPLVYKKTRIITLSQSSKKEIEGEKLGKVIGVVNPGIEFYKYKRYSKNKKPMVLFLNRIKKYKGLDVLLKAIKELDNKVDFELLVAGNGDYLKEARKYAEINNLKNVKFLGRISEEKKKELMQKAWVFVNPSFKEGWGIVNIEANYFGTPVIGSDVSGIKDSVVEGKTGLLFEYGDAQELAKKIEQIITNKKLRANMEKNSRLWAKEFDYSKKAEEYLKILKFI
jgi:glycosyltransferase involved in cell wall biosynthesis